MLASSSAPHVDPALTSGSDEQSAGADVSPPPAPSTGSDDALRIEGQGEWTRDRNDDDQGPFKLAKIFLGLTFQAAVALMIYRVQPQQGSTNLSPQGDPSANLPLLSAIQFNMVGATTLFSFASTMSGLMLRNHNRKAANFCSYTGIFLGALGFLLMLSIFAEESLDWLVWAVGGFLLLVFAYTIRLEMGI